jgi:hypothetical protein
VRHTYLLEEGTWIAAGTYIDDNGERIRAGGETTTVHQQDIWLHDGSLRLTMAESTEFTNRYEVTPLAPDALLTTWVSDNPSLGKLHGTFVVVTDSILSRYQSENGIYQGFECLVQIDTATYSNRGVLLQNGSRISSWALTLSRLK